MRYEMKMPDLSTVEPDIRVIRWLAKVGQQVRRGDPILEVETDKATMEIESASDGTVAQLLAEPEQRVPVGQVIAILETQE